MRLAARVLVGFWLIALPTLVAGVAVLQWLGPPHPARTTETDATARTPAMIRTEPVPVVEDPALLTPAVDFPGRLLPNRVPNGITPAERYRSRSGLPAKAPLVAILVEGVGLAADADGPAIDELPPAISLAVSPYAVFLQRPPPHTLLDQARRNGHELWLSLPMEPASVTGDEGDWALRRSASLSANQHALEWSLSRFTGYVGLTDVSSGMFGDGFADGPGFALVAETLASRGLLYVEGGPATHDGSALPPPGSSRHADLVLDGRTDATDIDRQLTDLERLAVDRGAALVVASPITVVLVDRLQRWSRGLAARGISLVPASALLLDHGDHGVAPPRSDGSASEKDRAS